MNGYNIREIIVSVSDLGKVIHLNKIYRNELKRMIENKDFMHTFNKTILVSLMGNANKDHRILVNIAMEANKVLASELEKVTCTEN